MKELEFLEVAKEALENRGLPVIYSYGNKIDISRGDQNGTAEPVYNHLAKILVTTEELRELLNPYEYESLEQAAEALAAMLKEKEEQQDEDLLQ